MAKHYFYSMSKKNLLVFLLSALMIVSFTNVPLHAYAASTTLIPTDDTYAYEGSNAVTNYGSSTILAVKTASGSNRYAFLKFDLSSVATVSSAKLRVYGSASSSTTLNAYATTDSWNETTLTWNNMPAVGSLIKGVPINTTVMYNEIDVSSYVQAQLAGDKTASLVLEETVGKYSTFNSKESGSNIPQLVIDQGSSGGGDTQAPTAPTNLTATTASSSQINLSWTASTDNVGVAGYNIYRNGTQVGSSTSTSYGNTGLSASTSYSYTVKAYDAAGNVSAASNTASATTASSGGIDYSIWSLQQPDGSTISSSQLVSGYTSPYFYTASDGGQALMDPQTGATTSGSVHPRSELREQTTSGSNAAWSWDGTNTMTNTAAVTLQGGGTSGKTTIAQVFDSTDSIPLCELEYTANPNSSGGNFQILYEEAKGAGTSIYFSNTAALNTQFNYKLSLSGGVLTVYINGQQVYSHTPSYSGKQFYFKTGDYDQTATSGTVITTPYTIVENYSINVVHQ